MSSSRYTPVDTDAERAVLAALLTSPEAFSDATGVLGDDDFGVPAHAEIYRACLAVDAAGKPVDRVTVSAELRRHRRLTRIGGEEFIDGLLEDADNVGNVEHHAAIVAERALLRRLVDTGRMIAGEALADGAEASEALEVAEAAVFSLGARNSTSSLSEMPAAVEEALALLATARTTDLIGVSTGFPELDRMTSGFQGGQLIVLAARPAMGKSAMALQLAVNMAEHSGLAVPFLSYEMSRSEITMRLFSTRLRYNLLKLRSGDLPPGMDRDLAAVAEDISQLSLMIDDNPPETISGVRSAMRRLHRRQPIGGIVIDYVQLMSGDRTRGRDENRVQEISQITRGLKRLASELDVPVVALSQLSRALEARPNKRPMLSDLRESGSIEQDASLVGMLYRDFVYNPEADETLAEFIIAKQRNGPVGTIYLDWAPDCALFSPTDRKPPQSATSPGRFGGGGPF